MQKHAATKLCPPSLLLTSSGTVLQFFGPVQELIRVRQGAADLQVTKLLPEPLAPIVMTLLHQVRKEHRTLSSQPIAIQHGHETIMMTVQLMPLSKRAPSQHFLLSLVDTKLPALQPSTFTVDEAVSNRMQLLEMELQATRESLQATIEELETTNEELQATNEELMASNEELQSANEELQSVNEELHCVNSEYQEKMLHMQRAHADLDTMSRAGGIATLFLDANLIIHRFTADLTKLFKIRDADLSRPIDEIVHGLEYPDFIAHLKESLASGFGMEQEVHDKNGSIYLVRMLPYVLPASEQRGIVVSFVDITAMKSSADLQALLDALPEHIAVLDNIGNIQLTNRAWQKFSQLNQGESAKTCALGINYLDACQPMEQPDIAHCRNGIQAVLAGKALQFSHCYPCDGPDEQRWFVMHVKPIRHHRFCAVISHFDVTDVMSKQLGLGAFND